MVKTADLSDSEVRSEIRFLKQKEKNSPTLALKVSRSRYCGLMVRGKIITNASTVLNIFEEGSITAPRYVEEVSEPQMRLFKDAGCAQSFYYWMNNARPHGAYVVSD
ncbi:hypothetical protein TNCV_3863631 [Trichonephila clavipes]|uniref:Uncharacterized protein n=1 Tax=Trichonephila clavipes TaxID=2585209 RepID=A0A8X6S3B2_TRICX|nr:hypothetical protein TNCV_3863631 [Trichonephila clavipes]